MIAGFGVAVLVVVVAFAAIHGLATTRRDAVAVLTLFAGCAFFIPARVILPRLGAAATPAAAVGIAAALWWLLGTICGWVGTARGKQPIRIAVLIYVMAGIIGYAAASTRWLNTNEANNAVRGLIDVIAVSGIALLAADGIDTRDRLETLLRRICLFASIIAAIGVIQYLVGWDPVKYFENIPFFDLNGGLFSIRSRGAVRRVAATADHPIEFGVVAALVLPFALHYAMYPPNPLKKGRQWAQVAVLAAAIPMSVSRSAIVAILVSGIVVSLGWTWRFRLNALILTVIYTGAMRAVTPGLLGTLRNLITGEDEDGSIAARTGDFDTVSKLFDRAPWFGRGINTFNVPDYILLDNQWLKSAVETGIVGLLALVLLFASVVIVSRAVVRLSSTAETRNLAQTLCAVAIGAAAAFATFDALFYRMHTALLALIVGCSGALWRLERDRRDVDTQIERTIEMLAAEPA